MTTTSHFQVNNDFYDSIEECKMIRNNKIQTNPRYKNFFQTHFTAGDENQFDEYRDGNTNCSQKNISLDKNIFKDSSLFEECHKYKDVSPTSVKDTFRYIFYKFKKGIFVKIQNNELKVFLPFSNSNFENEWSHLIKIDPKYRNINAFLKHVSSMQKYNFNPNYVNGVVENWYSNNSLMRYEYPIFEGDTNVCVIKNMLEELCKNRELCDIEFFINRRDFPLLTKGAYEPYFHLWDSFEKPLISHNYEKYIPILSMSSRREFADILTPTYEDWIRVSPGKHFLNSSKNNYEDFEKIEWFDKKPIAVFRGGSTGCGVTIETNPRIKLCYMSLKGEIDELDGLPFLDAGITNWNVRPRKIFGEKFLKTIDEIPFETKPKLSYSEQAEFKYIIHVEGHVSAHRLSYELSMNSVILMVESDWESWFLKMLKPYVHYVPIKRDLSNIYEIVRWCKNNDDICKTIAQNARDFYDKFLNKESIFDYMQKLFSDLKGMSGYYSYNIITPLDFMINEEKKYLNENDEKGDLINSQKLLNIPPRYPIRSYSVLNSLKKLINFRDTHHIQDKTKIFTNKFGDIVKFNKNSFNFLKKETKDCVKINEYIHEVYIGYNVINNILKEIPNFHFIFDYYESDGGKSFNIISEYTEGITLQEYLKSPEFSFSEYLSIILQICLALNLSQRRYFFVHNDLTPWNIILNIKPTINDIEYIVNEKLVINFKSNSKITPIIIDYGKSHAVVDDVHHGFVNGFKFSTIQDIYTLLMTSIFEILKSKYCTKNEEYNCLKLLNFLPLGPLGKSFSNTKDALKFIRKEKKYINLVSSDKKSFEHLSPMDLFDYITKILLILKGFLKSRINIIVIL